MPTARRLFPFGTTIFAEISRLASEHNAINLGQGFPDFDGPEPLKQAAIDAIRAGHGQYAPMGGVPELTGAIATIFSRETGLPFDPARSVTVTAGCTEAIAAALLGLLNAGDEVIVFEPYYDSYRACLAMTDAVPRFITLRAPEFTFDEAELRRAFTPRTRAVLLNTPHNPTGRVFSRDELACIADLCIAHNAIVIADEVYERLVFEGEHAHIAALPGMAERTITLSSLGKTFSLTGWKIGWAIAPPDLTAGVRAAHQFLTYAVNTPMQHAAAAALRLAEPPGTYYRDFLGEYRDRRDRLCAVLEHAGFRFRPPQGTYFILADHSPFGFTDDVAFCKHLIESIGVAAIPPTAFYENKEHGRSLVRFAFCKTNATLDAAAERLAKLAPRSR